MKQQITDIASALRRILGVLLIILICQFSGAADASAMRWGENYFPNYPVVTHEGKTLRFYDDLIKGKMVVVNYIYTHCPDMCPLATSRLALLIEKLGDIVGRDVFFYSITLDPERDTPEVLKEYAAAFGAGPGWLFLTGDPKNLKILVRKLGDRSRKLSEHRVDLWFGNDITGEWFRDSVMTNLNTLAANVRRMNPDWNAVARIRERQKMLLESKRQKKMREPRIAKNVPGQALFLKGCSTCHTVNKGVLVGPDLKDLTKRRDRHWLIRYLTNPTGMRAEGDPLAVKLDKQFPGVSMPNLGLSEIDANDLLTYIEIQSKNVESHARAGRREPSPPFLVEGKKTSAQ